MTSCNQKKRSMQRAECLQKQDENKAKDRALYRPIPNKRRPLLATATRPIPKRRRPLFAAATRPIPKRKSPLYRCDNYNALTNSRRTVLLKGGDMKRTSRETALQKYEDNSAAIKASKRSRYWNDPAVRLAKCASERTRYRRGHKTTTTTQRYVMACWIN